MDPHHIFIFSNNKGIEAQDLINFGLTEGSNKIHKGQGTTNRKFYFENFFLEILWVIDEKEITQTQVRETQLWKRANFRENGFSRYGLCLLNTVETDELFKNSQIYKPDYFPDGMSIDILHHIDNPKLPWTFRLPYRHGTTIVSEPINHLNRIKKLTKAEFGMKDIDEKIDYATLFKEDKSIKFSKKPRLDLTLEFDYGKQGKIFTVKGLDLTIIY